MPPLLFWARRGRASWCPSGCIQHKVGSAARGQGVLPSHLLVDPSGAQRLRRKQGSAARGQGVFPSHSSVDPSRGEEASPATHWLSCDLPRTLSPRRYACCSPTAQAKPAISSASNTQMPPSPLSPPSPSSPPWSSNSKARLGRFVEGGMAAEDAAPMSRKSASHKASMARRGVGRSCS